MVINHVALLCLSCTTEPATADLEPYNVHAVAAAVGSFFRELPEPLLTRDMYMDFLRAMGGCGLMAGWVWSDGRVGRRCVSMPSGSCL